MNLVSKAVVIGGTVALASAVGIGALYLLKFKPGTIGSTGTSMGPSSTATPVYVITVLDSVSKNPIFGANVVVGQFSQTTDVMGVAKFTLPLGNYNVTVTANGYAPSDKSWWNVIQADVGQIRSTMVSLLPNTPTIVIPTGYASQLNGLLGYAGAGCNCTVEVNPAYLVVAVQDQSGKRLVGKNLTIKRTIGKHLLNESKSEGTFDTDANGMVRVRVGPKYGCRCYYGAGPNRQMPDTGVTEWVVTLTSDPSVSLAIQTVYASGIVGATGMGAPRFGDDFWDALG